MYLFYHAKGKEEELLTNLSTADMHGSLGTKYIIQGVWETSLIMH